MTDNPRSSRGNPRTAAPGRTALQQELMTDIGIVSVAQHSALQGVSQAVDTSLLTHTGPEPSSCSHQQVKNGWLRRVAALPYEDANSSLALIMNYGTARSWPSPGPHIV